MLRFYTKFVVQRCIVCCDRRHLDKSTSDYIRNTGTRGGRIFVTLVTSTPQQMYVILLIYQYLYSSELQIFSRLSMHNIKITAASQPTPSKPSAIFSFSDGSLTLHRRYCHRASVVKVADTIHMCYDSTLNS